MDFLHRSAVALLALALTACSGGNAAEQLLNGPAYNPKDQTKCQVKASHTKPLITEWPEDRRAALEAARAKGMVVVRYDGCELELLPGCTAPGSYSYQAYTPKKDTLTITNADELYASVPLGAAELEGKLSQAKELGIATTLVGRYLADQTAVPRSALSGPCEQATHIVGALTVGAFEVYAVGRLDARGEADVGGARTGGGAGVTQETLSQGGDAAACDVGSEDDATPPANCTALVRIEVLPLGDAAVAEASVCQEGHKLVDHVCVDQIAEPGCPPNARYDGGRCQAAPSRGGAPPGMVLIPAGEFPMGCVPDDPACEEREKPRRQVYLDAFYIDRTEVTAAQYRACAKAGVCAVPTKYDSTWRTKGHDNHPMNGVTWNDADTYCRWAKKRLPTEAEWEKAARGTDDRLYPWGNEAPSCQRAVIREGGQDGCGKKGTWPVGSKPSGASPYGVLDMVGGVWEWLADYHDPQYYAHGPTQNPKGPTSGEYRVFRGSCWGVERVAQHRVSQRNRGEPGRKNRQLGIRCAKTAP